ncbi:MAG: mechanosensitive ion channel family protein [Gammaproteobacteria bacterium]|nr:mechanosensitive ion channel family protein [Gammaproteobacteria bacterium]MDH3971365.1 mechanosensitive ion channel family protein [Gammaproteobacteria bacterium]
MNRLLRSALVLLVLAISLPASVLSADKAVTTGDPEIAQEDLKLKLKPLLRSELKVEADAWLQLLEDKVKQISTAEIAVKDKLREISAAETYESALDAVEKAKNKAAEATDAEAAAASVREAEQALEDAAVEGKAAVAKVEGNAETASVTAIAAKLAAEKAALEKERKAAAGKQGADEAEAEEDDDASQAKTDATREKLDAAVAKRNEDRKNLLAYLADLRGEQTSLIDRTNLAIEAFELKGGKAEEVEEYRQYVTAVAGIEVDVTDISATWATLTGWLFSEEGGLRWVKNISLFLAIVFVAMFLARIVGKAIERVMARSNQTSQLLGDFLVVTSRRLVLAIGIIIGLAALEVNIGPLLAVIGAAGFVIAFALQDSLGNFASGILIMVFKPFDVGDVVEIGGVLGKVKSMNLLSVLIHTPDNKAVIIPNNNIWSDSITNVTGTDSRRVDLIFGIGYGDDIEKAQGIMEQVVSEHPMVLKDPEPVIRVHELADSSVNFICRPWVKTEDYWDVFWDVTRSVKERFDQDGVSIPFPQQDIHVIEALQVNSDATSKPSAAVSGQGGAASGDKQTARAGDAGADTSLDEDG